MFRTLAIGAVLALTITAAQAGNVAVNLKGVDLSDSQALAARIKPAAEAACGPAASSADNRPSVQSEAESDHKACVRRASLRAVAVVEQARARQANARLSQN